MVFTGVLAIAAWQDGRQQVIGTLPVAIMLALSMGISPNPVGAIPPMIVGIPWFWLYHTGGAGSAEPPAAVAIVFRHGITMGLMALGIACTVTAAALITLGGATGDTSDTSRLPFYPGLLIAHLLLTGWGAA